MVRARLRYFGHLMRLHEGSIGRDLVIGHFDKKSREVLGRCGMPLRTWMHCISDDLKARGFGLYSARRLAMVKRDNGEFDREGFRNKVVLGL